VETLNVKKCVNHSEKAVRDGFRHRNRAVSIQLQKLAPEKNLTPHACQTHAPDSDVNFMALVSVACVVGFRQHELVK